MIMPEPTQYTHLDTLPPKPQEQPPTPRNRKERRELKRMTGGFKKQTAGRPKFF